METYDVFVRGLTANTNKKDFEDLFRAYGKVQGISFKTFNSGSQVAFVRFFHQDSLDGAIKNLNGYMFQGAKLTVGVGNKTRSLIATPNKKSPKLGGSPSPKSPWGIQRNGKKEAGRIFVVGEHFEIVVTHIESAIEFWGQLADDGKNQELAKLIESLNAYCATGGEKVHEVSSSEVYGALFTADNVWYRTAVIEKPTKDEALIRYIDYGNTEMVATCSLVHLPEMYNSPPYAYKFRISGLILSDDESMQHQAGEEYLTSIILDKYLSVTIKEVTTRGTCEIELGKVTAVSDSQEKTLDVAKKLVECGYALFTTPHSSGHTTPCKNLKFRIGIENGTKEVTDAEFESLKEENAMLKEQLDSEQKEHQTALLEAISQGMQIQISNLVDKVQCLKELRSQMPLTSGSPKILDEAIQLVLDEDARVELSTLAEVEEVKNATEQFQKAQNEILNNKDKAGIEALISSRDKSRIELSDAINAFLVCAQQKLSVQTREAHLKYIYDKLLKLTPGAEEFDIHGDTTLVCDAVQSYKQFMEKVTLQRKIVQENSDQASQAVLTAMQALCQELSLDSTKETKSVDSAIDVTQLFQDYTSAVDKEAEELNTVSKMNILECEEVKCVLHSALVAIEKELKDIDALRESMRYHAQLQAVVDQWLVNRPDVTPLKTCRKISRKLRIEFGHKMVEQRELIDDEDAEELQVVTSELNSIRSKLQMAFAQEAEEMQRIASMVDQFPELFILYPEFNLQSFTMSGGLLLSGRSIEHFERKEHLLYTDQPAFRSTFNNTPCVIKEFHLTCGETMEMIVKNAQLLNKVQYPGLVRVLSTFKEANKVFVQLSNYGAVNLLDVSPSDLDYLNVFSQVLQTLSLLHEKGIAYGDLRPCSVWITLPENELDQMQVTLCDFALDKSESTRIKSSLVPTSKCESVKSVSSDMYSFGKLILWSIQPEATLAHYPDGSPRLAKFSISDSLRALLEGILHADPKMRFSASTALTQSYFTPAIPITPSPAVPITPSESAESVIDEDDQPPDLEGEEEKADKDDKDTSHSSDAVSPLESEVDLVAMPLLEYPTTD